MDSLPEFVEIRHLLLKPGEACCSTFLLPVVAADIKYVQNL